MSNKKTKEQRQQEKIDNYYKAVENREKSLYEEFEKIKSGLIQSVDINMVTVLRTDTLLGYREVIKNYWGEDRTPKDNEMIDECKKFQEICMSTLHEIKDTIETFDIEEFKSDDIKDYFEHIFIDNDTVNNEQDLIEAGIVNQTIQPYGQRMMDGYHAFQELMVNTKIEKPKELEEKTND